MMKQVKSVIIFRNGNIAAFDESGVQITELQKHSLQEIFTQHAWKHGYRTDGCRISSDVTNIEIAPSRSEKELRQCQRKRGKFIEICEIKDLIDSDIFRVINDPGCGFEEWCVASGDAYKNESGIWSVCVLDGKVVE